MPQAFEEWLALTDILANDFLESLEEVHKNLNSQFRRRAAFHFAFSYFEGCIFTLKQSMLFSVKGDNELSEAHIAMIKEQNYKIDRKGNAVSQKKFLRLEDNIKFTFKAFAFIYGVDFDLNLDSDPRWNSLLKCISIRNRITHPKKTDDMTLSSGEIKHIHNAFSLFRDVTKELRCFVQDWQTLR